jgi:hypothetical protein
MPEEFTIFDLRFTRLGFIDCGLPIADCGLTEEGTPVVRGNDVGGKA